MSDSDKNCGTDECCYASYAPKADACRRSGRCLVQAELTRPTSEKAAEYQAELKAAVSASANAPTPDQVCTHLRRAGVPQKNLDPLTHGRLNNNKALEGARQWWKLITAQATGLKALVLAGNTGVGKSTASAWVAYQFAAAFPWNSRPGGAGSQREPICWLEGGQLAQLSEWTASGAEELTHARTCNLLVINDGGLEPTKPAMAALANLMLLRLDSSKLLVFSTNLIGPRFAARYGDALADRLRTSACVPPLGAEKSQRRSERSEQR